MDHLDRVGEERDLATRGTISAKGFYSMVSLTLKIGVTLPDYAVRIVQISIHVITACFVAIFHKSFGVSRESRR